MSDETAKERAVSTSMSGAHKAMNEARTVVNETLQAFSEVLDEQRAEVTRLREELAQAKLDIVEGRALIASYDKDTRELRALVTERERVALKALGDVDVVKREYDEAAANHADALQITYDELAAAHRQLEEARGLLQMWEGLEPSDGRLRERTRVFLAALSPAPAPTPEVIFTKDSARHVAAPAPTCAPGPRDAFAAIERAFAKAIETAKALDAGAPRNPVKPCETCGVTGGEGFLITNDDGTPCLDRPCPTCSRSVKP